MIAYYLYAISCRFLKCTHEHTLSRLAGNMYSRGGVMPSRYFAQSRKYSLFAK